MSTEDLREKILFPLHEHRGEELERLYTHEKALLAMDEYFEKRAKELLEWIVDNGVEPYKGAKGPMFYKNKEHKTVDELFQDFL